MRHLRTLQRQLDKIQRHCALMMARLQIASCMYVRVMSTARPQDDPYLRSWKVAKDATWLLFLVVMYLQYYLMDVYLQIAALPALDVQVLPNGG